MGMTIMTFQFLTKETICTTVRQRPCKRCIECYGVTSTTAHRHNKMPSVLWGLEYPALSWSFA
eukprot:12938559-Prorocentrum_lima.AAC.1